jgi:hypothetical protein
VTVVMIAVGAALVVWSTIRDVGWLPGIIIGAALIVAGWDRHQRRHIRAAERRRRGRGGRIL